MSQLQDFKDMLCQQIGPLNGIGNDDGLSLVAMYSFYHYFNADDTKIDELVTGVISKRNINLDILGIFPDLIESDSVDFLTVIHKDYFYDIFIDNIEKKLNYLARKMLAIVYKRTDSYNEEAIKIFSALNIPFSAIRKYTNRILCDFKIPIEKKIEIQSAVANYAVKNDSVAFEILFKDDIQEEIDDIESPNEYVRQGNLFLYDKKSICYFGKEKSFLSMVSAKSLQKLFYDFGNKGLLDSNLRYFVSSKKIDPKIINTIQNESENFVYYNNGIIITCDNYSIVDNIVKLENFSIVNGGQTTNLIGRTSFDNDFPVICKVIKNKYPNVEKRVEFLSKVAEASNTQKPINAKDLIANKKEQRLLKIQFERAGIFLRVKRGEKIDKSIYKENWQNASNDEIAQMVYSMVFQSPGSSKNSKSKLLETDRIYNMIFGSPYTDEFFISLQYLKVSYYDWLKKLKKDELKTSSKLALAKNAFLLILATFGLIYKTSINKELKSYLMSETNISSNNSELRFWIQQNDIGQTTIFKKEILDNNKRNQFYSLFECLFASVLIPAYTEFKKTYPSYAYSHFVKSDSYYFSFVIPRVITVLKDDKTVSTLLLGTERQSIFIDYQKMKSEADKLYKPGIEQEIIDYRKRIYHESNKEIQAYEVITNSQLADVVFNLPRTRQDLKNNCKFKDEQIDKYGDEILRIVNKYTNIDDQV